MCNLTPREVSYYKKSFFRSSCAKLTFPTNFERVFVIKTLKNRYFLIQPVVLPVPRLTGSSNPSEPIEWTLGFILALGFIIGGFRDHSTLSRMVRKNSSVLHRSKCDGVSSATFQVLHCSKCDNRSKSDIPKLVRIGIAELWLKIQIRLSDSPISLI